MERIPRRPCIPLYESEGIEARERQNAGMTAFQVQFMALHFPIQNYVMLGFLLNNPTLKEDVKDRMRDERLEQLTAILKVPALRTEFTSFMHTMAHGKTRS